MPRVIMNTSNCFQGKKNHRAGPGGCQREIRRKSPRPSVVLRLDARRLCRLFSALITERVRGDDRPEEDQEIDRQHPEAAALTFAPLREPTAEPALLLHRPQPAPARGGG